jgi:hypothetical protein
MLFPTITERLDVAGYSGTPLPKKLGIKDGHRVAILGAPRDFEKTLGVLPSTVSLQIGRAMSRAPESRLRAARHRVLRTDVPRLRLL